MQITIQLDSIDDVYKLRDLLQKLPPQDISGMTLDDLNLIVRTANCLKAEGIESIDALLAKSASDVLKIPNFGRHCLAELRLALSVKGLKLRGD